MKKLLGIAGSLRKASWNKGLLRAAQELLPQGCSLDIFDLSSIPLYNQDLESSLSESVVVFKKAIKSVDAILFATAEYNYSISGVLKNAIDWASRPYGESAWNGKRVGIMGASPSIQGTSRAQYHLRQVCVALNMYPLNQPELMVGSAQDKFDAAGNLTDAKTREQITALVKKLTLE